eukprot:5638672-Pyramimonas_sp.AAC.1
MGDAVCSSVAIPEDTVGGRLPKAFNCGPGVDHGFNDGRNYETGKALGQNMKSDGGDVGVSHGGLGDPVA